jgi:hypothetical protein
MILIDDYSPATDLKVEFLLPDEGGNLFIIGVSLLGGTDVLGGIGIFILGQSLLGGTDVLSSNEKAFVWVEAQAVSAFFRSSIGGEIADATYFQPQAGTANITLQSYDFDPSKNKNIRAGVTIRVRVVKGEVERIVYQGIIDTIDVSYIPDGVNTIEISTFDTWKQIMNFPIATWDTTDYVAGFITPLQQMTEAVNLAGYSMSYDSAATTGKIPTELLTDITANQVINDAVAVGRALTWIDPSTQNVAFVPRPVVSEGAANAVVIGNDHSVPDHLCLSGITVRADQDSIINSLTVTLASDDLVSITLKDQDSIDLYGYSSSDVVLNALDEATMAEWAAEVFSNRASKLVKTVTTPAIDRLGNLTDAVGLLPGQIVRVQFAQKGLEIDDYYTIIKVNHSVDVNVWNTTLELWKES